DFQEATSIKELSHFGDHTLKIVSLVSSLVLYIISLTVTTKLTHVTTSGNGAKARRSASTTSESSSSLTYRNNSLDPHLVGRGLTVMSHSLLRAKDKCHARGPESNKPTVYMTRHIQWT
ncbi:hypothetical protein GH733_009790, partial [Mirounga leonina]